MSAGREKLGCLDVSFGRIGDTVVVRLSGELDASTVPQTERAVADAIAEDPACIVLELEALGFIDASGLRMLARVSEQLGERLVLQGIRPGVRRTFALAGVEQKLHFSLPPPRA